MPTRARYLRFVQEQLQQGHWQLQTAAIPRSLLRAMLPAVFPARGEADYS